MISRKLLIPICWCVGLISFPCVCISEKLLQLQEQVHDYKHKRFLALTAGAPGRTHDARLLYFTKIFKEIIPGDAIPDKAINLDNEFGKSHLLQLENAFPRFTSLLKMFNENTQDSKDRYLNKKLCRARVVAEN